MQTSKLYETYAVAPAKEIPFEYMKDLVKELLASAALDMGTDFDDRTKDRVIEIIIYHFGYLPLCLIASAFKKGALGQYGAGRLVPRTINGWLNEMREEHQRMTRAKIEDTDKQYKFEHLDRIPLGKAIIKKIDWRLNSREWDQIPLKELAERIGRGEHPVLADNIDRV